jgi:HK97 family phage major capsid protein
MNWLKKAKDAQNKRTELLNKAKVENRAFTEEEKTAFDALKTEIDNAIAMHEAEQDVANRDKDFSEPVTTPVANVIVKHGQEPKIFKNFTEQLAAIKNYATTGERSEKLDQVQNALGMNSGVGSEGAFGVQADFAGLMLDSAVKEDPILSRVDSYQISGNSDRVNFVEIDETDISTTVFGGVQVYRSPEASTVAASKPKLKEAEVKLEKLMGLAYATFELDSDSGFIDQLYTRAFNTAINRTLVSEIVSGDGVGRMKGILVGGGLVEVAKETNQTAATVEWKNISKMYHRALERGQGNWVWIMHPDVHQQLDFLNFPVGTGGVPVYLPASMTGTIDTLRGLPVLESDHCSALGTKGDIMLVDLNDYFMIYKGGVQKDVSIHVAFLTAENAFRFIFRANGRPKRSTTLKIKNSNDLRGKYISLATRG